jgi:hypothetical protein
MLTCQVGTVLIRSLEVSGNGGAGRLLQVSDAGMEGQEFLRPSRIFEAGLTSFLLSGGTVGLEDEVIAARRRDDLDVE